MKYKKKAITSLVALLLIGMTIYSYFWINDYYKPMKIATDAMLTKGGVTVINKNNWIVFEPQRKKLTAGFIIYPGGKVAPEAYAPTARAIAAEGFEVVIIKMPVNLAVFGIGKATEVIGAFPEIKKWAIGGHSLGGVMAARYVLNNPTKINGLVFWASYPDKDMTKQNVACISISASKDSFVNKDKLAETSNFLPAGAKSIVVNGGNHSGFGYYGLQKGDNKAEISREKQQEEVVAATVGLLKNIIE